MPAPPEVVDSVVQSTVEDHARRQSRIAFAAAFLFFVNAGLSDDELEAWTVAYLPWQRQAIREAAERGWSFASLLWSLQTDSAPDGLAAALDESPLLADIARRGEAFVDRPVVRARWEASKLTAPDRRVVRPGPVTDVDVEPPPVDVDVRPEVREAHRAARRARLVPAPTATDSTLAVSMERGAARAAEQAMSDTNQAFGAGMDEFASQPGRKVKRWLKAPHPGACKFCFLVSTRGFRTAQAAMRAGHLTCKCGAKAIFVEARDDAGNVSNWYWGRELERRGYGLLFGASDLEAAGRAAVAGELFPDVDVPSRA